MIETQPAPSGEQASAMCAVGPHPERSHDTIGLRYCAATVASGGWQRGCVCGAAAK